MSTTSFVCLDSGGTIGVFRRRVMVSEIEERTDFDIGGGYNSRVVFIKPYAAAPTKCLLNHVEV